MKLVAVPPGDSSNTTMSPSLDPEYRRCPVTGRWVIIAPMRARRPITLTHAEPHHRPETGPAVVCPLCEGAEQNTPRELYVLRTPGTPPDGPGWRLRVVPNKFPAVHPIGEPEYPDEGELFDSLPGFGEHEVVIECPDHRSNPTTLTHAEFAAVMVAYRERLIALAQNPLYGYATVFKNVGAEAGASLAHLHSQIIATPVVPEAVRYELETTALYYERKSRCVFCDVIHTERADGVRIVAETTNFVALCPFASRFGHEVWVLPANHVCRYETITDSLAAELGTLLKRVIGQLDTVLAEPAFNYFIHTAPLRSDPLPHYHWHIEIVPRTARQAGFEWGSGCFINAVPPEKAAAELRAVTV